MMTSSLFSQGWTYSKTRPNLPRDTYPALVANMDVLIYNGDWWVEAPLCIQSCISQNSLLTCHVLCRDACVPYTDNEAWTENMGFSKITPWHSWAYTSPAGATNQVAGYAVNYGKSEKMKLMLCVMFLCLFLIFGTFIPSFRRKCAWLRLFPVYHYQGRPT